MPQGVLVSSFGRPFCSVAEWVPHSTVLASGVGSVCGPLANEGVGLALLLLALLPLALHCGYACFGGLAGATFHLSISMRGFPRMVGLLAALLEVCLPGLSGWCHFRVSQIL